MSLTKRPLVLLACLIACALASTPVRAEELRVPLPQGGELRLAVPAEWQSSLEKGQLGLTVRLAPAGREDFVVLLSVLPPAAGNDIPTPGDLRAVVRAMADQALPGALQREVELREVPVAGGTGFAFHVTDRSPEKGPGDYREAHRGALLASGRLVSFTVLTHSDDATTVPLAIRMLSSLEIDPTVAAVAALEDRELSSLGGTVRFVHRFEDGFPVPAESDAVRVTGALAVPVPAPPGVGLQWVVGVARKESATSVVNLRRIRVEEISGETPRVLVDSVLRRVESDFVAQSGTTALTPAHHRWAFTSEPTLFVLRITLDGNPPQVLLQPVLIAPDAKAVIRELVRTVSTGS